MGTTSRILITGGAGFIGSHLARAAAARGHEVHATVRPGSESSRLAGEGRRIAIHRLDLRDEAAFAACLDAVRPDVVFHLAANPRRPRHPALHDLRAFVREDLDALALLLKLVAEARHPPSLVVRSGSLAEYGDAPAPYREAQREAPLTAYAANLVAATHFCAAIEGRLPCPVVTARLALVYGPDQSEDYLVPLMIARCLAGEEVLVLRPDDRRDLMFVADAVDGLLAVADAGAAAPRLVNLCSGEAPTMREVATRIVALTGCDPRLVEFGAGPPTGAADLRGSGALAKAKLGWRPAVSLAEGLARMLAAERGRPLPILSPAGALAAGREAAGA